jgi:hypothetical protein
MLALHTWRESHPAKSLLPDNPTFRPKKEEADVYRFTDPYTIVHSELAAIRAIDDEISSRTHTPEPSPVPIPSSTGCSYSKWVKQQAVRSAMNKAATCLSMRVAQRGHWAAAGPRRAFT